MKKVLAMVLTVIMMLALGTTAFADNGPLTVEQARQAALNYAGVNASEAAFTKAYKGYDNGREVYEIEFYANNTEYDMDVDVYTGRITDFSTEYCGMQAANGYGSMNGGRQGAGGYGFWDDDMYDWDHDWDDMYDWDDPWDFD